MAPRSLWKGLLKLSLVCVPVKAYVTAAPGGSAVHFHQLHAGCHQRIRHKKTCPAHGEVTADAIVSGYEYAQDRYVVVDPSELDRLRSEDDKAIRIDRFVPPGAVDPVYLAGKHYYLAPEGPVGRKAYAVICRAMSELGRQALAQVVMHGKDQLVLLRPVGGLLVLSFLHFADQVSGATPLAEEVPAGPVDAQELELARALVRAAAADKPGLDRYKDAYAQKVAELIEAKVAGKQIVSPPPTDGPAVIDLMDALKQSLARLGPPIAVGPGAAAGDPRPAADGAKARKSAPKPSAGKAAKAPGAGKRKAG